MSRLIAPARTLRSAFILGASLTLVAGTAGCASQPPAGSDSQPTTTPTTTELQPEESGDAFCADVAGIGEDLAVADLSADWTLDPQGYVNATVTAAERFASVETPGGIADAWDFLGEFFAMAASALEGVDSTDATAIEEALRFDDEDAFTMVLRLPGQAETVGVFVQDECGIDLGIKPPVITNVCEAVDPIHLDSVFGESTIQSENRRWGQGVVECMWDDGEGTEVGIVVGPLDTVRPDFLQGQEPIDAVQVDGASIDVYDGALGPLRAASGRTAATDRNDTAVLASVRTGDTDADAAKAIALAGLITEQIG